MTLGERIKIRRTELGLTLEDVSEVINVSKQTVQKYESGIITNIPSDKIEMLAFALRVSPAYIMGWEEKKKEPSKDDPKKSILIDTILNELVQLPLDKQKEALRYIRFLTNEQM